MSGFGGWATPGFGAAAYTAEREILWGRDDQHLPVLFRNTIISGATRDAGNTPTTLLRRGLLLGKVDATGELEEWDADATDGTQNFISVLNCELRAQDFDANNIDRAFATLLRGPVIASMLLIEGAAFVGHAHEFLARRVMVQAGFIFDDDPQGFFTGIAARTALVTGTTDTLTAAETGTRLFYNNAASVTVTLPAIKPGLSFDLVRAADEELIIVSAEGDNVVVGNDLSADGITFTTASEHLGVAIHVESVYIGSTLKWLIYLPHVPFNTGVNTLTFGIQT